jgi:hypothetical protein
MDFIVLMDSKFEFKNEEERILAELRCVARTIFSVITKHLNKEERFNYRLKDEFLDLYKDKEFA